MSASFAFTPFLGDAARSHAVPWLVCLSKWSGVAVGDEVVRRPCLYDPTVLDA
jgi:hypothetical protein